MDKNILLSIICPAYNAEKTIGKLIESIEIQNYDNYELIILNDGSKDKTFDLIKKYSEKYKNIIIIDKSNTGVGDTRNEGIKISKGKYITFADSDDYYSNDFFSTIIPILNSGGFDLLYFNMAVIDNNKFARSWLNEKYKNSEFIELNGVQKYLDGSFRHKLGSGPCNKIYIRKVIDDNKIFFEKDKKSGEDLIFNICYTSKIKRYKFINMNLYNYNLNSTVYSQYIKKDIEENIKYYKPIKKICTDNNLHDYEQYIGLFYLRNLPGTIINESNNDNYLDGKSNIEYYLNNDELKDVFKKIKIRYFDFKLFVCYFIFKLKCYKIIYYFLWNKNHRNK